MDDDKAGINGTRTTFWGEVIKNVQSTVVQAESCASFAMCERGRDSVKNRTRTGSNSTGGESGGRGGRKLEDSNSNTLSTFDHLLEAVHGFGGEKVPGLSQLQKAYTTGVNGLDCSKHYKKCPVTPQQLNGIIKDVGDYIFA